MGDWVRALKGMIQALPAFIEPTSNALVSQGISIEDKSNLGVMAPSSRSPRL